MQGAKVWAEGTPYLHPWQQQETSVLEVESSTVWGAINAFIQPRFMFRSIKVCNFSSLWLFKITTHKERNLLSPIRKIINLVFLLFTEKSVFYHIFHQRML